MSVRVLVPEEARGLFLEQEDDLCRPIFYARSRTTVWSKALARAGFRKRLTAMPGMLIRGATVDALKEVRAVWLADWLNLGSTQAAALLDALPGAQWAFRHRASLYKFDTEAFSRRGVALSNSGDLASGPVSEFMLACVLAHAKRLPEHCRTACRWGLSLDSLELAELKIGIVGTGSIGSAFAALCGGLGIATIGVSRNPSRFGAFEPYDRIVSYGSEFHDCLPSMNVLAVALPLNESTASAVTARELSLMPRGSVLISVSHPDVVRIPDLEALLLSGQLGAAYFDKDPGIRRRISSLYLTSNSASNTGRKLERAYLRFREGVIALEQGKTPTDRVA